MIMATKARRHYELRVVPGKGSTYGLALFQRPLGNDQGGEVEMERVVQVWGDPLRAVMDQVLAVIKRAGYRPSELSASRKAPFTLGEEDAVRIGLLFQAVKPLKRHGRIESISEHVRAMEPEELYYWFSKTAARASASRAQRALRILMAGE